MDFSLLPACGFYSRAASKFLFKEIFAAFIQGRFLIKGGFYSIKYGKTTPNKSR